MNYEEHFAHDLLTGVLEDEGLDRRARRPTASTPRSRPGPATTGPTIAVLLRVRRPARASATPAGTTSSPPPASAPAWPRPRWPTRPAAGSSCSARRPRRAAAARSSWPSEGAFDGVDAAMMVHPAGDDLARMNVIAVQELVATYTGEAAHAAAFPHRGRNALDAAVLGYLNVAALRQHIRPDERIHGVFTRGGREAEHRARPAPSPSGCVRSHQHRHASSRSRRGSLACLEAGRRPRPGCDGRASRGRTAAYADMLDNEAMVALYAANAARARPPGRRARTATPRVVGSTDMGNVSYLVPSIHPMIAAAPVGPADPHPRVRRPRPGASPGDRAVVDGAMALAWTVADLWLGDGALEAVQAEFAATMEPGRRRTPRRSAIAVVGGA